MNFTFSSHRTKELVAGSAAVILTLTHATSAFAALTSFEDVPAGTWYEADAAALIELGSLDSNERMLRPNDLATRAEFVKLLVRTYNVPYVPPSELTFDDVKSWAWYYPDFETAAKQGWVKGDGNCAGVSRPCTARPGDRVNRAEAAALLLRAFNLTATNTAPVFGDNTRTSEWYYNPIQIAADHCVLQGDDLAAQVRPSASMNRAEMIAMTHRASQNLSYGRDCGKIIEPLTRLDSVVVVSPTTLRLSFSNDLLQSRAEMENRYTVVRADTNEVTQIRDALRTGARTVDLTLETALRSDTSYRLNVQELLTTGGTTFSDYRVFTSPKADLPAPAINSVESTASTLVRVTFNSDLDAVRAEETFRYSLMRTGTGTGTGTGTVTITRVVQLSDRQVELQLGIGFQSQAEYSLTVNGLRTKDGTVFSGSKLFTAAHASVSFTALLQGLNEVPATLTLASGSGTFTLSSSGLQYDISLRSLTGSAITGAHFHLGAAGVNGPVIEPIAFNGLRAKGAWADISPAERDALLSGKIYVNVHTNTYPNGEIRGQVVKQ